MSEDPSLPTNSIAHPQGMPGAAREPPAEVGKLRLREPGSGQRMEVEQVARM